MRGTDKYVVIFGIAIVLLVIIALAVAAMQPDKAYMERDGPEAVAHNYLLAIEEGDLERAYSYLSPDLKGYPPNARSFVRDVRRDRWQFPSEDTSTALTLLSVEEGEAWAEADARRTYSYGWGLFGFKRNTDEFELQLEQTDQGWKIVDGERLFLHCWTRGDCN